jgi:hypothetical protein
MFCCDLERPTGQADGSWKLQSTLASEMPNEVHSEVWTVKLGLAGLLAL